MRRALKSDETIRADCALRIVKLLSDPKAVVDSRPALRARAADTLARLGDPRFDPQRFYLPGDNLLGFVRVPADPEFMIGTRRADAQRVAKIIGAEVPDHEINDTLTPTPEFYIARYPVTVAQFRASVEARQYKIGSADALCDPDNRPVRWVTWHEALAYCDWLNDQIVHSPALKSSVVACLVHEGGWRITLPSELEWEKAARGELRDTMFAWGDTSDPNRANYRETQIGDTTAVGCFPANNFGLYDMIGNVWEWTRSHDSSYPYHADDGREELKADDRILRVVRGGSWNLGLDYARCAYRYGNIPGRRLNFIGFRLVLRSPPVR